MPQQNSISEILGNVGRGINVLENPHADSSLWFMDVKATDRDRYHRRHSPKATRHEARRKAKAEGIRA